MIYRLDYLRLLKEVLYVEISSDDIVWKRYEFEEMIYYFAIYIIRKPVDIDYYNTIDLYLKDVLYIL